MKLKIEKGSKGVLVELETDTSKKPLLLTLNQAQVDAIIHLLQTAKGAERFKIQLEL